MTWHPRKKVEYAAKMAGYDAALKALRDEIHRISTERKKVKKCWDSRQRYLNDEVYRQKLKNRYRRIMKRNRAEEAVECHS